MKFSRGKVMAEKYADQALDSFNAYMEQGGNPDAAVLIMDPKDKRGAALMETVNPEAWEGLKEDKSKGVGITVLPRKDLKGVLEILFPKEDHHVEFRKNVMPIAVVTDNDITVCRFMVK